MKTVLVSRFGCLLAMMVCPASAQAELASISGRIECDVCESAPIVVRAIELRKVDDQRFQLPSKEEFFQAAGGSGGELADASGEFKLLVSPGAYGVFGFCDVNENGRWDPNGPEALGWYSAEPAGGMAPLLVGDSSVSQVEFRLQAPTPFADSTIDMQGGRLRSDRGYIVLELYGDARTRGYAHGKLIAPQIIDFFRFYILEEKFRSASKYEEGFAKFLQTNFAYPQAFVDECQAVIEGMRDSDADLFIPELDRDFTLVDLYAINGYIETRAMRSSCTQFAAWGERTRGTDVDGGMITGRNMDGEIDVRKVTVSHFLLFAVEPTEPGHRRFVSMMWPGFVATISGINEDGFYTMENAGPTGPGTVVDQLVPFSWTMRESLVRLGADASPGDVQQLVDSFDNSAGGSCGPGCVTLFAMPFHGQKDPAFVLEGDRFGDRIRFAEDVSPKIPQMLIASNHHRIYGVDPGRPEIVFGRDPGFSSRWRYEAGANKAAAWYRTGRSIGTAEMRELLQAVAHGTTEYAIITRPNASEFDVSVASMNSELWDAPYRDWTTFSFDELFTLPDEMKPRP